MMITALENVSCPLVMLNFPTTTQVCRSLCILSTQDSYNLRIYDTSSEILCYNVDHYRTKLHVCASMNTCPFLLHLNQQQLIEEAFVYTWQRRAAAYVVMEKTGRRFVHY
uniref:Uncharacterized protein n=1 Tax=Pyxicephalus adspersus TaxID=30357 RepID=A0AAV3A2W7_PYXAD|nr:TPA: hypothetical protein GDO54_017645 [Pyxicephalus adspersus]